MNIDIITIFPEIIEHLFNYSIIKNAKDKKIITVNIHNLRDYATNKYRQVDDYQYGGEAGMVIMIEPVDRCLTALKEKNNYDEIIYMSPDGDLLTQKMANSLSLLNNIIIICGHYKGIDQRIRDHLITKEISIGEYVLTGGELPAAVLCDSIIRLIPSVLNDETSALTDSFQDNLLSTPVYTRPANYKGFKVPDILLSGDTKKIKEWNINKALEKTKLKRPDLYKKYYENNK